MEWQRYTNEYELYLRLERNFSANTVEAYLHDLATLRHWAEPMGLAPADITVQHLRSLTAQLTDIHVEPTTQCRVLSGWRAFFHWLVVEDAIAENPAERIEMPTRPKHLPDVLTDSDIEAMQATFDCSKPGPARNYVMTEVLYGCGLRVSELINLKLSNIYDSEQLLQVIGKGDKERWVPINPHALRLVQDYILYNRSQLNIQRGEELYVFLNLRGHRMTRVAVFQFIKEAAAEAGIHKQVSPHSLRHSFATELVQNGADLRAVQEMLGHESLATTEIYTHLTRQYLRDTISTYHPHYKKG